MNAAKPAKQPNFKSLKPDDYYSPDSDVRTLTDAHKIRSDKPRHAAAKAHAKKKLDELRAVGGLMPMAGETKGESPVKEKAEGGM